MVCAIKRRFFCLFMVFLISLNPLILLVVYANSPLIFKLKGLFFLFFAVLFSWFTFPWSETAFFADGHSFVFWRFAKSGW